MILGCDWSHVYGDDFNEEKTNTRTSFVSWTVLSIGYRIRREVSKEMEAEGNRLNSGKSSQSTMGDLFRGS